MYIDTSQIYQNQKQNQKYFIRDMIVYELIHLLQ